MIQPFFSVIIPIYNRVDLFGDTLQSVINQEYEHWELILVDDGSTQENISAVKDLIKGVPSTQWVERPKNMPKSASSCRNYGASLAKGTFFIFLDSDDILSPNALKVRAKQINNAKARSIHLFPSFTFSNQDHKPDHIWNVLEKKNRPNINRFFDGDIPWHTSGTTWPREIFQSINGFYGEALSAQDWEIHIRLLLENNIELVYHEDHVKYWHHGVRRDNQPSIVSGFNKPDRVLNRLETFGRIVAEVVHQKRMTRDLEGSIIASTYRTALSAKKAGLDSAGTELIIRTCNALKLGFFASKALVTIYRDPQHNIRCRLIRMFFSKKYNLADLRFKQNATLCRLPWKDFKETMSNA